MTEYSCLAFYRVIFDYWNFDETFMYQMQIYKLLHIQAIEKPHDYMEIVSSMFKYEQEGGPL